MSDILRPIHDRRQRPILSGTEAMSIEWLRVSYQQVILEREERIAAELASLRRDNATLAKWNDALSAENRALRRDQSREHERLVLAEQCLTVGLVALAAATLAAVVWAVTTWR